MKHIFYFRKWTGQLKTVTQQSCWVKPLYKANFEITALYVIIRLPLVYKKERSIYKIIPAALQDVMYPNFMYAKNDAEKE